MARCDRGYRFGTAGDPTMIGLRRTRLENQEHAAYRAVIAFLEGRLRERATIDWALQLKTRQTVQRLAILDLIEQTNPKDLGEPWLSAWSLIQEAISGIQPRRRTSPRAQGGAPPCCALLSHSADASITGR